MTELKSSQNNQGLVEWSKWISGISLFSASGCVGVLVSKGVGEKNIINIKLAIVFFLLSVIVAWLIQLAVAMQSSPTPTGKTLKSLIAIELIVFILSCFFLARWVWKFPPTTPASSPTISLSQNAVLRTG